MSIATYSFLPYLRQGIANTIQSSGGARGTFTVKLDVHGDEKTKPVNDKFVDIYGPGDVVGIDVRAIVKTDPHNRITNFEANYLAHIDFYDEDFPWRYTPVPASGQRLNPWMALVVLAEGEFDEGHVSDRPLPFFRLKSAATKDNFFPKKDQLWAWAHVHFNGDLTAADSTILVDTPSDVNASLDKLQNFLNANPDFAYSRLICPRKLKPSTAYHAFVIPAYESGRLAGIGKNATDINAAGLKIAWEGTDLEFPYYYRWDFSTGTVGDFEYLVRLLKPKVADSRIGRRVMDMTKPGGQLTWTEDPDNKLGGILRLGGALRVPKESLTDVEIEKMKKFDEWATKKSPAIHPFQIQVAGLLNLADDYNILSSQAANTNAKNNSELDIDPNEDADPLITPPIYGRWHAMVERVYKDKNGNRIDNNYNWLNELNLDPRFRVPAHFGTRVVQENQEDYMQAAWEQVGDVLKANRQIRFGQFALAAGVALHAKHFAEANQTDNSKAMLLTAPLQKRVMHNGFTVFHNVRQSPLPNTILSAPMRRIVRPRGRMITRLQKNLPAGADKTIRLEALVTKINAGELLPSPPKVMPPALPTVDAFADQMTLTHIPAWLKELLKKNLWLKYVPWVLAVLLMIILFLAGVSDAAFITGLVVAGGLVYLAIRMAKWSKELNIEEMFKPENQTPKSVDLLAKSGDFRLSLSEEKFTPKLGGAADNDNALRFKNSLKDMYRLHELVKEKIPPSPPLVQLKLNAVTNDILEQIRPEKTIPAWTWEQIFFPQWLKEKLVDEGFVEAMAYPKINIAMYNDLKKISDELFLPNVNLIENNSITLLETNQPFIESYMVGLNHEFARELLWREYPTDQRGSYFRQFWDTANVLKDPALANKPEDEQREPYYDITKLHEWRRLSKLGDHDNRQKPGELPKQEVVLVIRGELLKKYPTAVVYAHKAEWTKNDSNQIDVNEPRSLANAAEGDKEKPDPKFVRTPLYSAKVDPDIYFFGFDLSVKDARGETRPEAPTSENAGWFFVIKERPGEPRFGFDIPAADGTSNELVTWNDLDWSKVVNAEEGVIDVLNLAKPVSLPASHVFGDSTDEKGKEEQYKDDKQISWNSSTDAANIAYILYQVPMMVCVHAAEMLLKK
jgi:hypothetical protein